MTDYIVPGDSPLSTAEIERRIMLAFDGALVDRDKGRQHVASMIAYFRKIERNFPDGSVSKNIAALSAVTDQCSYCTIEAEDPDAGINFAIIPGEKLVVGYASLGHQTAARPTAKRVADVLGYQFVGH